MCVYVQTYIFKWDENYWLAIEEMRKASEEDGENFTKYKN
jgi:hypothetical protein